MPVVEEKEIRGHGVRKILYGHLLTLDTGVKVYVARRKRREIFRNGRVSISGAMTEDVAAWAIDESLLMGLRAKGVSYVGVRELDTGDLYITRLSVFFDRKTSKLRDYTGVGRGGSRQRYVPLSAFTKKNGVASLDAPLY